MFSETTLWSGGISSTGCDYCARPKDSPVNGTSATVFRLTDWP